MDTELCAVSYSRVSSDRQQMDLSVSGQQRAIQDWADRHGYILVGEYVDEAESGRIDSRRGFSAMIRDACAPTAKFNAILVWKHDRFSRKREHAVVYKSRLKDWGVRLISITEPADDTPTGRLLEAVIEGLVEFYSDNLSEDVTRGMREAALRGNFLGSRAPFGYRKVKGDGAPVRFTLEVDPLEAGTVHYVFKRSLEGMGLKEICKALKRQGITNRGKPWLKPSLYVVLTNEAYSGTLVWGRTRKRVAVPDPVRVEGAWPALVSREMFDQVQESLAGRSPAQKSRQELPIFLLNGLLECWDCGNRYMVHGAKSNRYFYYVCSKLHREGAGACRSRYLNAPGTDEAFLHRFTSEFATPEHFEWLITSPEGDGPSPGDGCTGILGNIKAMLEDVGRRLEVNYDLLESHSLPQEHLAPRISFLRKRQDHFRAMRADVIQTIARIEEMTSRHNSLGGNIGLDTAAEEFRACVWDGSDQEKRDAIRVFVDRIVVGERGDLSIHTRVPLSHLD